MTLLALNLLQIYQTKSDKYFNTFTFVTPTVASNPISEAPIFCPDCNTIASFSMSHPFKADSYALLN